MNSDEKDRKRRRRDPFNFFGFDDRFLNDMFDDRIFDDFRRMTEEMFRMMSNAQPGKSYVHGYNIRIGPDGRPRLEEFGNHRIKSDEGKSDEGLYSIVVMPPIPFVTFVRRSGMWSCFECKLMVIVSSELGIQLSMSVLPSPLKSPAQL